jgi:glycerol-3-phosphate dehydrogenase
MAEDTIDRAAMVAGVEFKKTKTKNQRIHGWLKNVDKEEALSVYGSDKIAIEKLMEEDESLKDRLHPKLPYIKAEVVWAIRNEWAQTIEDILSRRTRALLLDAEAAIEVAPIVAELLAEELGEDKDWQEQEVKEFNEIAKNYVIN